MSLFKAPKAPKPEPVVDRDSEAAKSAYANATAKRRQAFGEENTDIVGSIVSNDNNAQPQINTQLKKLMGASA